MRIRWFSCSRLAVTFVAYLSASMVPAAAQSDVSTNPSQLAQPVPTQQSPANTAAPQDATSAPAKPDRALQMEADQVPTPTMTIRETVRRVIVDVMVRDSSGKPVHGLTADDFSIVEDNQTERVLSFDAYDFDKQSISRGPNAPPLPPNVFVNIPTAPERGPLYVMLYDLVNTEMEDQMTARAQILKFIASKPAGTRFAIFVTTDKLYLVQGFTDDKEALYAALDPKHPKHHVPRLFLMGRNSGYGDPYTAMDMLTHIGQYLDGFPGRKNLIWVAGRFDVALFPQEGNPVDLQQDIRAEINALAQAQVAVFPVDLRGVVVNPEGALTGARPNGGANNLSAPTQGGTQSSTSPIAQGMRAAGQGSSLNTQYATEESVAEETGGRAFYSTNDVTDALEQATEDGANYYTLTYSPPSHDDNGKCHNIGVKLAGEKLAKMGYQLSYRRSYCRVPLVSKATEESGDTGAATLAIPTQAGDILQANIRPGAPMVHDLIFSAHLRTEGSVTLATPVQMEQLQEQAAFFRTQHRNRPLRPLPPMRIQTYGVDYRVLDPQLAALAARNGKSPTLEFAVAAFDDDGKVMDGIVNDATPESATNASGNKTGLYRVHQSLVVPVGAKSIRVGVRDRATDRLGTLEVQLPLAAEASSKTGH
jgi:VWFA-related protein